MKCIHCQGRMVKSTMDQMEQNHCMCWKFEGLRELVDYADLYAMMAPRPLMCQNGLQESETQFWVPLAQQALKEIEPAYADAGVADRLCLHVDGYEKNEVFRHFDG